MRGEGGAIDTPTFPLKILSFRHVKNVKNVKKIAYFRCFLKALEAF